MVEKKKTKKTTAKSVKPAKTTKHAKVASKNKVVKSVAKETVAVSKKSRSSLSIVLYMVSVVALLGIITFGLMTLFPCDHFLSINFGRCVLKNSKYVVISSTKNKAVERVTLNLEIADNDPARLKGLMGRENLEKNTGMLFDFEEPGDYSMWMKDTLIPLDMIFVNNFNKIIALAPNRKPMNEDLINPCTLEYERALAIKKQAIDEDAFLDACEEKHDRPSKRTRYVIELPAGTIKANGIRLGDILLKK